MITSTLPDDDPAVSETPLSAPAGVRGPYQLQVLSGMHQGASIELHENSWLVLGSCGHCDVVLRDESIAQQHCLIGYQAGDVTVRALDGGVHVSGRAIQPGETVAVTDYEPLQVGVVGIAFGLPDSVHWTDAHDQWSQGRTDDEAGPSGIVGVADKDSGPPASPQDGEPSCLDPRSDRRRRAKRFAFGRRARLAFRSLAVTVLVLGGLAGSWHGVSQATNTVHRKAGVMKTITQMGFTELVLSKGPGGLDLLTGVVPTEADRAELVNVLAKAGLRPASDIVTGEHLAMAVQNEFRQRGWSVATTYLTGGTVLVDGLAPSPEIKALEGQVLRSIRGVKQLTFLKETAVPDTGTTVAGLNLAATNRVNNTSGSDSKGDGKRITGVVGGVDGYLVTADGSRYSRGALMQDGTEIERIADGSVTFVRKGKSLVVDF